MRTKYPFKLLPAQASLTGQEGYAHQSLFPVNNINGVMDPLQIMLRIFFPELLQQEGLCDTFVSGVQVRPLTFCIDHQFLTRPDRCIGIQIVPATDLFHGDAVPACNGP